MRSGKYRGWALLHGVGVAIGCLIGPLEAVTIQGKVHGYALNPSTSFNLPYTGTASVSGPYAIPFAKVIVNSNPTWVGATNALGEFSIPTTLGENSTATVRVTLEVPVSPPVGVTYDILNRWGENAKVERTDLAKNFQPTTVFTFNAGKGEVETAQVTAFLHLRQILDYAVEYSADWNPPYAIGDFHCEVNIEWANPCVGPAGGYANYTIYTRRAATCSTPPPALLRNTAYSTILYHEFGHNFMRTPGYDVIVETNEVFADLMSAYFTGSPLLGKDLFGAGTVRRDISEVWIYPVEDPVDTEHDPGRPFTGSMWEVLQGLVSVDPVNGAETASQLYFGWMRGYIEAGGDPVLGPGIVVDVLQADEEVFEPGGDYRPPHGELIAEAFGHHNLLVPFRRGDANSDGDVDVSDPVFIFNALFYGEDCLCWDAADGNDDGQVNVADVSFVVNALFYGGPPPPPPYPDCGEDEYDSDGLFCIHGACS